MRNVRQAEKVRAREHSCAAPNNLSEELVFTNASFRVGLFVSAMLFEQRGVDAIIAQGLEAGGHRGMFLSNDVSTQVGTFALVPQAVRAVKVPVIAAGGIASADKAEPARCACGSGAPG